MVDLGHAALGAWSGGRFMHFGKQLSEDELVALLRPDERLRTVVTADVYGQGEADRVVGRAIADVPRRDVRLVGTVGHDFYDGERRGAKGFPRFTDPALRGPDAYADYLRAATERSLERCGTDRFDLLMLHNPDRIGYTSEVVWDAMAALRDEGLADAIGVAPGPANGFTLDILACLERFGDRIDWAMLILGPLEPWPSGLVLPACEEHEVQVLARVVDYGGIFWGDLRTDTPMGDHDHRRFRPDGWIQRGLSVVDEVAAIGARHGLTPLQTAAQWTLAQPAVSCVVPTLIQEMEGSASTSPVPVAKKRAQLAAVAGERRLTPAELDRITQIGDNTGSMALKGASPVFAGDEQPDAWSIGDLQAQAARRWGIDPDRQLVQTV
ncbi:aldo/keto reductase [Patulibacter sp. SYSU D01012]|uniref:aldo/keto reductase n=1 Tax=Patulibacter sp. SYSU D01012 TaxID=2817381 RepID=UPI001B30B826|nr:aldo/keto reductase [Patulibacter sp. SYSU D01012]